MEARRKWKEKLRQFGYVWNGDDDLLRLCIDPNGRKEVLICTAVYVRDVLKAVRRYY